MHTTSVDRHTRSCARERGIALLMTLGILSLLLIVVMSFAYSAKTEALSANVSADISQARLLADSGLARVMAAMRHAFPAGTPNGAYPPLCPTPPAPVAFAFEQYGTSGQYYLISKDPGGGANALGLVEALTIQKVHPALYAGLVPVTVAKQWQLVKDAAGKVIGRIGYLVLDESGKVDVNGAMTPNWEPYYDANGDGNPEYYLDLNGNGAWDKRSSALTATTPLIEGQAKRWGSATEELEILDKFFTNLPFANQPSPQLRGRWDSLQHMMAGLPAFDPADYLAYSAGGTDIDAYVVSVAGVSTDRQRFDLSGCAWDPSPVMFPASAGSYGWDHTNWSTPDGTPPAKLDWLSSVSTDFWNTGVSPAQPAAVTGPGAATGGMPHFGTPAFSDADQRRQALANLVDFCDSNNIPTWGDADGDGNPEYVGLEKVPYINEVQVHASYDFTSGPPIKGNFSVDVAIELVNMYADGVKDVKLGWEVVCKTTGANAPTAVKDVTWTFNNLASTPMDVTVGANSYKKIDQNDESTLKQAAFPWTADESGNVEVEITSIRIVLTTGSGVYADYAVVVDATVPVAQRKGTISAGTVLNPNDLYFDASANDPRCNTKATEWPPRTVGTASSGTIGAVNAITIPPGADAGLTGTIDPALATTPVNKYIANRPIRSMWELGAVHRGEQWSTLRLTQGGASGDAALLDQVKIGPWQYVPGKVNANSPIPADATAQLTCAWARLLYRLEYGDTYDDTNAGATAIDDAVHLNTLLADPDFGKLTNRGELYKLDALYSSGATDMEKESAIGRLANLLTVRKNLFTVIVVGQAVKDLVTLDPGAGNANDSIVEYEQVAGVPHYCRILSEQKQVATMYRDALRNRCEVLRTEYLDEE